MSSSNRLAAANQARRARQAMKSKSWSGCARGNSPKVRRHSNYAGEHEKREWKRHNVFSAAERRARRQALQEWNYSQKEAGASWGPLGPSGERFLDSLMGLRCYRTGRLDLSIKAIAAKLHMCLQTVVSYVARCESLGLLVKLRRSLPIADPEPGGPQVEQITNAYWFQLTADLAERVRQLLGRGGKPADQEDHEQDQAAIVAEMLATLSAEERAAFHAGDVGPLAAALRSLGRRIDRGRF